MNVLNIPAVKFVDELPQWITASDLAAYHPATATIWIRRGELVGMGFALAHELLHHLIHLLGGQPRTQRAYDRAWGQK